MKDALRCRCGRSEPSPGADAAAARSIADRAMGPNTKQVPAQMWQGVSTVPAQLEVTAARVESRCRCGASRRRAGGRRAVSDEYPEGAQQLPLPEQVVLVERHDEIRQRDVAKHTVGERHGPEILGLDRDPEPSPIVLPQAEPIHAYIHTHVA